VETVNTNYPARFYFKLGIGFVLPESPRANTDSHDEWISKQCVFIENNLQKKLCSSFDEVQFSRFTLRPSETKPLTIYFVISKCYDFRSDDIEPLIKSPIEFKIKNHALLRAKSSIDAEIRNSLCSEYFIADLSLKYIASRYFTFEVYLAGFLTVERTFSPDEILDSGGVSDALSDFVDEMSETFHYCALSGYITQSTSRRNKKNQYIFEVSSTCYFTFNEREVDGDMALLEHDMTLDDIQMIGIDNNNEALDAMVSGNKHLQEAMLEEYLPVDVTLLKFDFYFIDQDYEVHDVENGFLVTGKYFTT